MFLSLAKGDPAAKQLLSKAIRARYGLRPLMITSLHITLQGEHNIFLGLRAKVRVTRTSVENTHWRWETHRTLFGLPLRGGLESFDGGAYYHVQGGKPVMVNDPLVVSSYRRRLWAESAMLLSPLSVEGVVLKAVEARSFQAYPETSPADIATVTLNEDDTIAQITIERFRPEDKTTAQYVIRFEGGLQTLAGVILPAQLLEGWADRSLDRYQVMAAVVNEPIPLTTFTLGG